MVSKKIRNTKFSGIGEMINLANKTGGDIIRLETGDIDFSPPKSIAEGIEEAFKEGFTHYTPFKGYIDLREAIVQKLKMENGIETDPENILVTSGGSMGLFIALFSMLNPGDEIIITDPSWCHFEETIKLSGARIKTIPLTEENKFKIDINTLDNSISRKTKMLLINSPHNPTGSVLDRKLIEDIAEIAEKHKIIILADEEYEKFVYDNREHYSIGSVYENTITVQSFSKTYAICGLRLGYLVAKKEFIDEMTKLNLYTIICAPSICQRAVLGAMKKEKTFTKDVVSEFEKRRNILADGLNKIDGIKCARPEGGTYVWPNISQLRKSSYEVAKYFVEKARVVTVAGSVFGKNGEGYLRLSLGAPTEKIIEAVDRIKEAVMDME